MKIYIKLLLLTSFVVFEEEGMLHKLSMLAYGKNDTPAKPANAQKQQG